MIQVILNEDVPNVGRAGEVVKVRDGFGRNYLLPQKKAMLADPKNLRMLEHHQRVALAQQAKLKAESEKLRARLEAQVITFTREAGIPAGEVAAVPLTDATSSAAVVEKLFGSVTVRDIAEELGRQGFTIDRRDVRLTQPIRVLGDFDIQVRLPAEVLATLKVRVVKKV